MATWKELRYELLGRHSRERQLHPDHLDTRLPLTVYTLLQPVWDVRPLRDLPVEESQRLGGEVVELALQDRQHRSRFIRVDDGFDVGHCCPPGLPLKVD